MFNFPPQVYIISRNIYVIYHLYICFRRKERTYLSGQPWARAIDVLRQLVVLTDQITHRYLVQDLVRLPVRPVLCCPTVLRSSDKYHMEETSFL